MRSDTASIPVWNGSTKSYVQTIVDLPDTKSLSQIRWHLSSDGYVRCKRGDRPMAMHRIIMGTECLRGHAVEVDHINRNRLDNRRSNLRLVSTVVNQHNRGSMPGSSSQFRGVTWHKAAGRWQGQFRFAGSHVYVGLFDDEAEAGAAVAQRRNELLKALKVGA